MGGCQRGRNRGQSQRDEPVSDQSRSSPRPAARKRLRDFIENKLRHYEDRNQPVRDIASGLSPYLHFGYISAHQVLAETSSRDDWNPGQIAKKATGAARGWWGASEPVEAFLDELFTRRELGYNMCSRRDDHDQYDSLPDWAQKTFAEHARDSREYVYTREQFEAAETHDDLWNAAQRQLVREGLVHNDLRMLWGKKILERTASPRDALDIMIELNNKYALDGRDPKQLQRHLLGPRPLRSGLGAGAAYLR